jgi:hypothetical protein
MELVSTDASRVVYLTQLHRPTGGLYLPEAAAKLAQRYSFAKLPTLEDLLKDTNIFHVGKFQDIQINELSIYNDGIIVAGGCRTEILEAFVHDLMEWAKEELGLIQAITAKPSMHHESSVIVKSTLDLGSVIAPKRSASNLVSAALLSATGELYKPTGYIADCDFDKYGKRKPGRFHVDRRVGTRADENVFFSQAPMPTENHLEVLRALEALGLD